MQKSDSIKNLATALITFHVKVGKIKKDAKNPFFKSKYATLSTILEAIDVPLQESGLAIVQLPDNDHSLTTLLMHSESGEWIMSNYKMSPVPEYQREKDKEGNVLWRSEVAYDTPQGIGSAMTYARRYALGAILQLNIDDDDDANAASGRVQDDVLLPWLNEGSDKYNGAVAKLKLGQSSIEALKKYFRISKEVEAKLRAIKPDQPATT